MASSSSSSPDKYDTLKKYEDHLSSIKMKALAAAAARKLSAYLRLFGITWATVIVLGGLAHELLPLDFAIVSALLLRQAACFAASATFGRLPTTILFTESHHPDQFTYHDHQYYRASLIHAAAHFGSSVMAAASVATAAFRLATLRSYHAAKNTTLFLFVFYVFSILESAVSIVASFLLSFIGWASSADVDEPSAAFYDAVYSNAVERDLTSAYGLSPIDFAFNKLRSDLMRGIQPPTVEARNRRLVDYIYDVPTGIERAYHHLVTSEDMYRQLVAVNLARFWAEKPRMKNQIAYLVEVGKKMSRPEKLAEAASYAIERLADKWADYSPNWPWPLLQNRAGHERQQTNPRYSEHGWPWHPFLEAQLDRTTGENIVDMLAELVVRPIRSSLVFQLRALESCCRSRVVADWIQDKEYYVELCEKLVLIVEENGRSGGEGGRPRQRTKIYAASALFHLLLPYLDLSAAAAQRLDGSASHGQLLVKRLRSGLELIHPDDGSEKYVWKKEVELLNSLRRDLGFPPYDWGKLKIKNPADLRSLDI